MPFSFYVRSWLDDWWWTIPFGMVDVAVLVLFWAGCTLLLPRAQCVVAYPRVPSDAPDRMDMPLRNRSPFPWRKHRLAFAEFGRAHGRLPLSEPGDLSAAPAPAAEPTAAAPEAPPAADSSDDVMAALFGDTAPTDEGAAEAPAIPPAPAARRKAFVLIFRTRDKLFVHNCGEAPFVVTTRLARKQLGPCERFYTRLSDEPVVDYGDAYGYGIQIKDMSTLGM